MYLCDAPYFSVMRSTSDDVVDAVRPSVHSVISERTWIDYTPTARWMDTINTLFALTETVVAVFSHRFNTWKEAILVFFDF